MLFVAIWSLYLRFVLNKVIYLMLNDAINLKLYVDLIMFLHISHAVAILWLSSNLNRAILIAKANGKVGRKFAIAWTNLVC